ncbi:hypothetical protein [Burkholderia sp. AU45388]|uniref:hypothetical protein n=1 Tax=Burkholderia sp. AU45388 TaxID=3059206 RepID=UPI00264F7EB1|nr:hypothetical protein [Burkholderia sp. AU45388]MDN7431481.1 hypothetical protein [Burkholderia sp. AU45388]
MKADAPEGWRHAQLLRVLHALQRIDPGILSSEMRIAQQGTGSSIISFFISYDPVILQSESN